MSYSIFRYFAVFLIILCGIAELNAQSVPRAGRVFTFAVFEGPNAVFGDTDPNITLMVYSDHTGCGTVYSPHGFYQEFQFRKDSLTLIKLDKKLEIFNEVGKLNKGIIVTTSQPVNCMMHLYDPSAGDATQLYPNEALDTSYLVPTWGIFNDFSEDNRTQIIVTAAEDNTNVTIVPTVRVLPNYPAGQPIRVTLNRGECFMAKADALSLPSETSLSRSTVSSDKPVSVISAMTCTYVPLAVQSCNGVVDQILPRKYFGTEYFIRPVIDDGHANYVLITSDSPQFTVAANGIVYLATNGQTVIDVADPTSIVTSVPTQCHLFTSGSSSSANASNFSDPSMVTLLPVNAWDDTLVWPHSPFDFNDHLTLVYEKASEAQIMLDGTPINLLGVPISIPSSTKTTLFANVDVGVHKLISPTPVYAIRSGFQQDDAYTFLPGGVAPSVVVDTLRRPISLSQEDSCGIVTLTAVTDSVLQESDSVYTMRFSLDYDPSRLSLQRIIADPLLVNAVLTIDTSRKGLVIILAKTSRPVTGSGAILSLQFSISSSTDSTYVLLTSGLFENAFCSGRVILSRERTASLYYKASDNTPIVLRSEFHPGAGQDTVSIQLDNLPGSAEVKEFTLSLSFNDDLLEVERVLDDATLIEGWESTIVSQTKGKIVIRFSTNGDVLDTEGELARLLLQSFVTVTDTTTMVIESSFEDSQPCGFALVSPAITLPITINGSCADNVIQEFMRDGALSQNTLRIQSVTPNPNRGTVEVKLTSPKESIGMWEMLDMLGKVVWSDRAELGIGACQVRLSLPSTLMSGGYILRVMSEYGVSSTMIHLER